MAVAPADRYPTAEAVMRALLPFTEVAQAARAGAVPAGRGPSAGRHGWPRRVPVTASWSWTTRPAFARFAPWPCGRDGVECEEAGDGPRRLEALAARPFDLVLLDIDMPKLNGTETLKRHPAGAAGAEPEGGHVLRPQHGRRHGPDARLARGRRLPAQAVHDRPAAGRVKAALRLKDAQDRSDLLNRHLLTVNADLEQNLSAKDGDLDRRPQRPGPGAGRLVEARGNDNGAHLLRMQQYCRRSATRRLPATISAGRGRGLRQHAGSLLAAARHRQGRSCPTTS